MSAPLRSVCLIACAVLALVACSTETEPLTQIVVVIDSDFSGLTRFEAKIEGFEEPHTVRVDLEDEPLPQRFSLVHDGGPLGPMAVTVRAYTDGDEPILVEPRTGMFFKAGQTMLLQIDLLAVCVGLCDEGQACIDPGECVSSDDAAVLIPWTGPPPGISVGGPLDGGMDGDTNPMPDGSMDEGGLGMDATLDSDTSDRDAEDGEPDAETDAAPDANEDPDALIDAGQDADVPDPIWPYVPSNLDVEDDVLSGLERNDIALDCESMAIIDSSDPPSVTGFCDAAPEFAVVDQLGDGGEVLAVVMSSLSIDATSTLKLVGSRPIVLLVEGDVSVAGTIDASAEGSESGPGGNRDCAGSTGATGNDAPTTNMGAYGASGGGGGGFGSPGMASGVSGTTPSVAGGMMIGDPTLVPLRGGCSGGAGGLGDAAPSKAPGGGGGGAVQISVVGTFELTGVILAAGGGGGAPTANIQGGGGGGGSGGAVLIEAETYAIDAAAIVAVNGGAGGGGQPTVTNMLTSTAGGDGLPSTATSTPGTGTGSGGDGGRGAALGGAPTAGGTGLMAASITCPPIACLWGGAGGGGGGIGRIRIRNASGCVLPGIFSPAPVVDCESCGACPAQPDFTCTPLSSGTSLYSLCPTARAWSTARMQCTSVGLDLVKIDDEVENDFVLAQIADETWLGAGDTVEDDWRWVADNSQFWSGDEDGDPVASAFNDWETGDEPNGSGDCARITEGGWLDTDCADPLPFLCEQP
jgi:hypothetical protein